MSWMVDVYGVTSFIPVFYTLLVTTSVICYRFVLRVIQGHWYMWQMPLLAPVTAMKCAVTSRLGVVTCVVEKPYWCDDEPGDKV